MSCDCDAEMPEFMNQSSPTAKIDHKCSDCHGIILKGEKYHRYDGKWDDFATYKICDDCMGLRDKIGDMEHGCTCIPFEGLCDEVFDGEIFMKEYVEIKKKRCGKAPEWMIERVQEFESVKAEASK